MIMLSEDCVLFPVIEIVDIHNQYDDRDESSFFDEDSLDYQDY